ncbi:MAG: hypothetical protein R3C49_14165 [Planctomycetaceae bacterium]
MNQQRPSVIRTTTRAASGGAVVVVALLALMFFKGIGGGTPTDGTSKESDANPPLASADPTVTPKIIPDEEPVPVAEAPGGLTQDEQAALSGPTLGILIDERSFLLEVPADSRSVFRPASMERLVELAAKTTGDTNGIRVRILQRETARPSAMQNLTRALEATGIRENAIYVPLEFVP